VHFFKKQQKPDIQCFQWISGFFFSATVKDEIMFDWFCQYYLTKIHHMNLNLNCVNEVTSPQAFASIMIPEKVLNFSISNIS